MAYTKHVMIWGLTKSMADTKETEIGLTKRQAKRQD